MPPRASDPLRILAVGPHPDDVEFGCGAILIGEAKRGHAVTVLNLSRGESATSGTPEVRAREAAAAAERMGVALEWLPLDGDARLQESVENAFALARAIRRLRPQLLLAPLPVENQHPDHFKAGRMVRDAARLARYGGLTGLGDAEPHSIDALYFYDITGTGEGPRDPALARLVVDVSDAFATWTEAMRCHVSQMKTRDYLEMLTARSRLLGTQVGVEHALAVWANDPVRLAGLSDLRGSGRRF
ncbi:MAG TPA: PIG-L family deacetylase [Verrucomicrobiae bacterium]|nr:PIG-L family deacetylase [Verrucomicrobiae bacterium]